MLENRIYVYKFVDLKLVDAIDTNINSRGLVALNPDTPNEVLATPDKQEGFVKLTLYRKSKSHVVKAHEHAIAALALNPDGRLLATASIQGTLIRLTNTETGSALQELRRGSDTADIFNIAFDMKTTWISVTSDKATIHVFAVTKDITDQLSSVEMGDDGSSAVEEIKSNAQPTN